MFNWIKPKNFSPQTPGTGAKSAAPVKNSGAGAAKKDQLIREAMTNAKTAREAIGEETLAKVRELMQKQQQAQKPPEQKAKEAIKSLAPHAHPNEVSPMEQAKKILLSMEPEKLADHLRMLREHDKTHH